MNSKSLSLATAVALLFISGAFVGQADDKVTAPQVRCFGINSCKGQSYCAAVVYRRRQHVINLLIAPAEGAADTRPASQVRAGYNIVHWTKSGMSYWAVSSLSAAELGKFAQLVSEKSSPAPAPGA